MSSDLLKKSASDSATALIVVDQQYDFEPGGALAVEGGDEIVEPIAELMMTFKTVVLTQDAHPAHHISFASSYSGMKPFDVLTLAQCEAGRVESVYHSREAIQSYLKKTPSHQQVLWPDHCVQGTRGSEIDKRLPVERADLILRKGVRIDCDSYSAFFENDRSPTGLDGFLKTRGISKVVLVGLAGDYCVGWSAKDARRLGFDVVVPISLTRSVNFPAGSWSTTMAELKAMGCSVTDSYISGLQRS